MVETELDVDGLASFLLTNLVVFLSLVFSFFLKSDFFIFFGLWTVFGKQFKELTCYIDIINIYFIVRLLIERRVK